MNPILPEDANAMIYFIENRIWNTAYILPQSQRVSKADPQLQSYYRKETISISDLI